MAESVRTGWEQWTDPDGTLHFHVVITPADQRKLGPITWETLQEAGLLIGAAFTEPD